MEGDGPIMGRPRAMGVIAIGPTWSRLRPPARESSGYLVKMPMKVASRFPGNIDEGKIDQRGENPARYRTLFDVIDPIKRFRA